MDILENVSLVQREAILHRGSSLLLLAGAGSGKTLVITRKIAYLIKECEVPPEKIMAVTFTNKAANEMKNRVCELLPEIKPYRLFVKTFHSACLRILKENAHYIGYKSDFIILDEGDKLSIIKKLMKENEVPKRIAPKGIIKFISSIKNELEDSITYDRHIFEDIYNKYLEYELKENLMDFDDLILYTIKLFEKENAVLNYYKERFKYILVDEFQDTNPQQYKLIKLLTQNAENDLTVVGDDDQSIYRFRGATIENILNFEDEFTNAKTIRLEQNYRSTGNILDAANAVISHNLGRKGKELWTESGEGEKIKLYDATDERSEAAWVVQQILDGVQAGNKFSDNAVLYRMNAQSAAVENVLVRSGIAYRIVGGHKFFDRKEIKDVLAYLQLINNNNDDIRLRRVINEPKRGIGETTVTKASDIAQSLRLSLFEVFLNASDYPSVSRAGARLREFCDMIRQLSQLSAELSISELYEKMLALTGYRSALLADDSAESRDRLENVNEFASMIKQYEQESEEPSLSEFLEQIALFTDLDTLDDNDDRVVLMTIHSAKGLEFNRVFLIGMEEGIFPGMQSVYGGAAEIEEERRLAYVAITRARRQLFISRAQSRLFFGKTDRNLPSRFLKEIPEELCENCSPVFRYQSENRYGGGYSVNRRSGGFGESVSGHTEISFSNRPPESPKPQTGNKKYTVGQRVEHTVFGNGVICSVTPMGGDLLLGITFEKSGNKKIMASYAKLKIL